MELHVFFFSDKFRSTFAFHCFYRHPGQLKPFCGRRKAGGLRGLSCQILHWSLCCKPGYAKKPTDTAKVAIKSEKPASFGDFFNNGAILALPKSDNLFQLSTVWFSRKQRQDGHLANYACLYFKDNRDNRNNKKNGRNCGMSRGDIQLGQQDYCWQLVFPQAQGLCSWCDEIVRRCRTYLRRFVRRCRTFFQGFLRCSRRNAPVYFLTTTETTVTTGRTRATGMARSEIQLGLQGLLLAACFFRKLKGIPRKLSIC